MDIKDKINLHINTFLTVVKTAMFDINSEVTDPENWFNSVLKKLTEIKNDKKSLFFIGNGASASIASHFAADFTKNGGIPSFCTTDNALITSFSNDYSYEDAYMEILKKVMKNGDALFAISSSGTSKNILNAVKFVKDTLKDSPIITLSSFSSENPLRKLGYYNLYLPSKEYSYTESGHVYYLHILADLFCSLDIK